MKKLFVLFVIAASIGIYTQCNNNTESITIGSDELIGRTLNSDCDYNGSLVFFYPYIKYK